jgi:DNA repair exonuclease SbcCD ATPase subunit
MGTEEGRLTLDQKTIDVLIANIIPTSKYFEIRFDHLEQDLNGVKKQLEEVKNDVKLLDEKQDRRFAAIQSDIDYRFTAMQSDMDKRFTAMQVDMDKRFEQVDKRFEQIDKRFTQMDEKLDKIIERIDRTIDEGLRENRAQSMRMFTFAMTFSAISMVGLVGKIFGLY